MEGLVILALISFLGALLIISCAPAAKSGAEAAYLGEQLQCVDKAKTLEESQTCRAAVRLAWSKDSGAE